jgi:uncharacterized protein
MSEENVEIVRRAVLGWNERGVDALIEALDPNVEFHPPKESMNPGVYRGHDGVREYFRLVGEVVEDQRVGSVDVIEVDEERVIATVQGFGKFAHFDEEVEVEAHWSWLIRVRDGKGIHVQTFTDQEQALEAAGGEGGRG